MQDLLVDAERLPSLPPPLPTDPSPFALLALALGAGVALDAGLRGSLHNGLVALGIAVIVVILTTSGRVERTAARGLAFAVIVPAAFLVVRASPWLEMMNVVAIVGLITASVSFSRSGSVLDTTPFAFLRRIASAAKRALVAPAVLRQVVPSSEGRIAGNGRRVARAVTVAFPILLIVIALLASADAVFKDMIVPNLHANATVGHAVAIALLALLALSTGVSALGDARPKGRSGRFEALEIIVMLSLAVAVLALFAVAQLVALSDAGHRLVIEAGLTPAEYARSGFFQLCWATAFFVGFLAIVRGLAAPGVYDHTAVRVLAGLVPLLAIGLVVVSLRRMALYDAAFGMTMLRLWVIGAAIWMGLLLAMFAARNIGIGGTRSWLVSGAGASAFALLMVANIANPEALVVRHNVIRAEHGRELDAEYLANLSDDAIPSLIDAFQHSRSAIVRSELRHVLYFCTSSSTGAAAVNVATIRADNARRRLCPTSAPI